MNEKDEWQRLVEMKKIANYWMARCSRAEKQLEQREWISVKDRMPEKDIPVITYDKEGFMCIDIWKVNKWAIAWFNDEYTHWMPLPQKPESEDDTDE